MARGAVGWDDSLCAHCGRDIKVGWEEIAARKNCVVSQYRNKGQVISELSRPSKYREKAWKQGVIRPFLLLVAMPPIFRNQVACSLGWSTFTSASFGDPHHEAWQIINKSRVGMQARANRSYEKLDPLIRNANWYEILIRVGKSAFFGKDLSDPVKSQKKEKKESAKTQTVTPTSKHKFHYWNGGGEISAINNPKDPWIADLEEDFLEELSCHLKSQMTEEQKQQLDQLTKDPQLASIALLFVQNAGIKRKEVISYGYNLVKQVVTYNTPSILVPTTTMMLASMFPAFAAQILPFVTVSIALLSTPLFFIGVAGLCGTGLKMLFGSSEGRVFVAVCMILNQRLLLAVEGIQIEDFY